METKLNYKRTFLIGLAFLSICSFWQMYDNIIPLILQNTYHLGETMTGAVMALDNVLAIFLLPVFGMLSDKVHTKLGRRMPFIVAGTILAVIFMMLLPMIDNAEKARWSTGESFSNQVIFLAVLFFTLVSMGLYRSPAVALMPDVTPNHLRSRANAVINLMGAVGGVYALIMIKVLVGKGETPDYLPLFASIAAVMAIAVGILVITIRENKLREEVEKAEAVNTEKVEEKAIAEGVEAAGEIEAVADMEQSGATGKVRGMPKEVKRSMYFMLASIFLWFTAYNAVTTAFSRYTKVVWKMEGGSFANCLMVATVAAILSYIPIGNISAKIGRKKTIMGGVLLMAACYGSAIFAREYHPIVNVAFALIGVAWAAINVNSYPMIVAMSSGSDVGKFTGTYYTFSMAAQILTPVLSGFLLENVSYNTLFPYALFFSLMAFLTMTQVRHGDVKPKKKESILENFDVDD
ncbi:MAG: MFS transporter [Lachnospiraceae bacterium]|nr:MFS transporter [Lachnospiraceae bacterium]MDY3658216.1 MFS transporter [Lachnospiraceae bacterium]